VGKERIITVLCKSGRPYALHQGGVVGTKYSKEVVDLTLGYFSVLEQVYAEHQSAGGNWDAPSKLLIDGVIVIDGKLSSLAWDWGQDRRKRLAAVEDATRLAHAPAWLLKEVARG